MNKNRYFTIGVGATLAVLGAMQYSAASYDAEPRVVTPANMPRIGTVDERFQSYNIEMVEVIGGRFWKPYKDVNALLKKSQPSAKQPGSNPVGMDPNLYQYRPPIDLTKPRLRRLAAALGPAYVRISGTWANTTYFQDSDTPAGASALKGFNGVLTRGQWRGVVDFSHAVDAKIITSFATSPGTRNSAGVWTPDQARRLLAYTTSIGGSIDAAEFMNEPTYAAMGGAPKGYDAAAYGRDIAVFSPFIKRAAPELTFLGPGSVGEGGVLESSMGGGMLHSKDLLKATGPVFDVFSYHLYAAVSERCASMGASAQTTAAAALSAEWLNRIDTIDTYYEDLRDKFEPGKPLWITETADAACGGNPGASTFLDSFRYLDQHGRLAKRGVKVIMHNTLASSDYGLLDENTLAPRPNYWASLLWRKFMGTTVLDAGPSPAPTLHLYAHCLRGQPGGIGLLAINTDRTASHSLDLTTAAERYTLSVPSIENLEDTHVQLNGTELKLGADDAIPQLSGMLTGPGRLTLAPATITFVAIPKADNASCR
jgi:heparanase 1